MRLTKTQYRCLVIMIDGYWHNAQTDKQHLESLNALSLKKLVETRHEGSLLWRITGDGRAALAQSVEKK